MRVLVVSADMGEGHNATGRALEDTVRGMWPDADVTWLDTLDVMGPGVGRLFRWIYVQNVETTPWLYEFFYRSLWRMPWFAGASKAFVAAWAGRRLAGPVRRIRPDVVLSTYPLGSAGLEWLRRRWLTAPVGAWVSDFAPHPFWVYRDLDLNLVMHEAAVPVALACVPDAPVVVSAPPVRRQFRPGDRAAARDRLQLPADAFVVLVSCGSFGFGDVEETTREVLAAGPDVVAVVVCGRNEEARAKLEPLAAVEPRLRLLGWTDRMPDLTVAADVIVTNAGGATSLEAIACGRPIVLHRPIAAHGRANAALMEKAGLAVVSNRTGELTKTLRELVRDPDRLQGMAAEAARHAARGTLEDGVRALLESPHRIPRETLRPQDALFVQVASEEVPQQLGTAMLLGAKPDGSCVTLPDVVQLLLGAPRLGSSLDRGSSLRRPAWVGDGQVDMLDAVREQRVEQGSASSPPTALTPALDDFFSSGISPPGRPLQARLVTGFAGGQSLLLIKIQHACADGVALTVLLAQRAGTSGEGGPTQPVAGRPTGRAASRRVGVRSVARGLWRLAAAGPAPRTALNRAVTSSRRRHTCLLLPLDTVRAVRRLAGASTSEVVLTVLAEALHRVLDDGRSPCPPVVRVLVPVSVRTADTAADDGNLTTAARVDLPTGPMTLPGRLDRTREALRRARDPGSLAAAGVVVRTIGLLPPGFNAVLARAIYRGTWFSSIVTVLPGLRSAGHDVDGAPLAPPVSLDGAPITLAYPVLPLAPGVGVSVGVMTWGQQVAVCVTSAHDEAELGRHLAEQVDVVTKELLAEMERTSRRPAGV
ncbi:MAG: wax ester/triacylglycerol synthase domain-containing protein [Actinomycetes bacterium]